MTKKIIWKIDFNTQLILWDLSLFLNKWIISKKDLSDKSRYILINSRLTNVVINIRKENKNILSINKKIINKSWKIIMFQENFTSSMFYFLYNNFLSEDLKKKYPEDYKKAIKDFIPLENIINISSKDIQSDNTYDYEIILT